MDSTIVGLLAGFGLIFWALVSGGDVGAFWDPPSILITMGGTVAAILISYPFSDLARIPSVLKALLRRDIDPSDDLISKLVGYANKARREGLLALEEEVEKEDDPFLQRGIQLIVDGTDPELVRDILETELAFIEERHKTPVAIMETGGAMAPAFGMLGTLIGLIQMLGQLNDPSKLGSGMAVALITTFYGSFLSNLIFLPIAAKLRSKTKRELLVKEVVLEGVLSIQAGENPRIVGEKLKAFLASNYRDEEKEDDRGAEGGQAKAGR
jgi:chemotaxis protein MotA